MKQTIRHSAWETNSSSIHTITIMKKAKQSVPDEIYASLQAYGWEFEVYDDPNSKISYLISAIYYIDDNVEEKISLLRSYLDEINVKLNFDSSEAEKHKDEYHIDHGCELDGFIKDVLNDKNLLYAYLFSEHSKVKTGNDNADDDMVDSLGLSDADINNDDLYTYTKWN